MKRTSDELFNRAQIAFEKETMQYIVEDLQLLHFPESNGDLVVYLSSKDDIDDGAIIKRKIQMKVADVILGLIEDHEYDGRIRIIDQPDVEKALGKIERAIAKVRSRYERKPK